MIVIQVNIANDAASVCCNIRIGDTSSQQLEIVGFCTSARDEWEEAYRIFHDNATECISYN